MTPSRKAKLAAARLKRQSDLFHAFEWLRSELDRGNHHAVHLMKRIVILERNERRSR